MIHELQNNIARTVPTITGWCSLLKAQTLASIVIAYQPNAIVEIGVWGGKSLIPMAMALREIGSGQIHAIDPWHPSCSVKNESKEHADWWKSIDHEKVYTDFCDNIQKLELGKFVNLLRLESDKVSPKILGEIELLHVDGNHSDQAINDVERFAPQVPVGGIVVLDDISWTGGAVLRAVDILLEMGFKELYRVTIEGTDNWAVFQRV